MLGRHCHFIWALPLLQQECVVEMLKMKKVDAIFLTAIALTAIVSISAVHASPAEPDMTEPKETVCQPTTAPTVAETTEATQEPTETTPPVTEATQPPETTVETEPPVILYDVPLATDLQLHIISEAEAHSIDPVIIFAMAFRESSFNPAAIGDNGNSFGLLQIQHRWHQERMERLGCSDLLDPFQNVTVGVDILAEQIDRYEGNIAKALVAYNQGHFTGTVTDYAKDVLEKAEELRSAE